MLCEIKYGLFSFFKSWVWGWIKFFSMLFKSGFKKNRLSYHSDSGAGCLSFLVNEIHMNHDQLQRLKKGHNTSDSKSLKQEWLLAF